MGILALLVICAFSLTISINKTIEAKKYRLDVERAELQIKETKHAFQALKSLSEWQIENLKIKAESLEQDNKIQDQIIENYRKLVHRDNAIPANTIEAVKYAMKKSHPDNGGRTEDFMKFKKCYEELTRK